MPLRAITFDYWDTLYVGAVLPERITLRQTALRRLLAAYGCRIDDLELGVLYRESAEEAERWWRDEHRGYTAADRIGWVMERLGIVPRAGCEHLAQACAAVDDALLLLPPPLLPGAADALRRLARHYRLAVVSDTGFASGRAQDRLLEKDGVRQLFAATIYSADIGHAKPRAEPFAAAARALDLPPQDILHVGDNERTDVRGALAAGMRAMRVDFVRAGGPSKAERVVREFGDLVRALVPGALAVTG